MTSFNDVYGSTFFVVFPKSGEAREYCVNNKFNWFNYLFRDYSHAEQRLIELEEQSGIDGFCVAGLQLFNRSKTDIEKQFKRLVRAQKRLDGVLESLADSENWTEQKPKRAGTKRRKKVREYAGTEGGEV